MLKFCDFIQVYVFTSNHHLKIQVVSTDFSENGIFVDDMQSDE